MSEQKNEILHEPPLLYSLKAKPEDANSNQDISTTWQNYFTNQRSSFNQFFPVLTIKDLTGIAQVSVPTVTSLSQEDIDNIENAPNGSFLYNATTQKFNFRENGIWVAKENS
jgi:hypothetical protein